MKKEFNLSEKMKWAYSEDGFVNGLDVIPVEDVKEFIKIVLIDCSEAFESNELEIVEFIMKKRAGKELI